MAADTSLFRAGPYQITYGGVDLGETQDGVGIVHNHHNEIITIDRHGDSPVDGIYRGRTSRVDFKLTNPSEAGRKVICYPYDDFSTALGTVAHVGQTLRFLSRPLVLTPIAGVNSNNKTITVPVAVPIDGQGPFRLNTKLRVWECNLLALVDPATGAEFTEA